MAQVLSGGGMLLLHWTNAGAAAATGAEPRSLELPLQQYTKETSSPGEGRWTRRLGLMFSGCRAYLL